ncbi:L-rhamnose mutarotase [Dyella sp. A6]|uniref:L-rhamnose mutarotase n=1 Tax=Dyella aluminiiresistens TaxID=3069105 RepID=UPI002E7A3D99|nr:L-rhamnose mutarotase [Dyella sp. A6]
MSRHCFALDLRDNAEAIAEYERWHQASQIWPEVVASIRAAGIENMEIFRTGNRLLMVMDAGAAYDPKAKAAADANDPRIQQWEALMNTFQQALPWAQPGQKWVPMQRIFSLASLGEA